MVASEGLCAGGSHKVLAHGHDRNDAEEADQDEGVLHDACVTYPSAADFALPLDDRVEKDRVPKLVTMSKNSRIAPEYMAVSEPAPGMKRMSFHEAPSRFTKSNLAGIEVAKVAKNSQPVNFKLSRIHLMIHLTSRCRVTQNGATYVALLSQKYAGISGSDRGLGGNSGSS